METCEREGYDKFLVTGKLLLWQGTAEDWKRKMSNPTEYGDEVVLNLACNLLSVTIIIIPAFKESGHNSGLGITFIKALNKPQHPPIFLFYYPDSDFISPHYQSVRPRSEVNVLRTFLTESESSQVTSQLSSGLDVFYRGPEIQFTEENSDSIPIVLADEDCR